MKLCQQVLFDNQHHQLQQLFCLHRSLIGDSNFVLIIEIITSKLTKIGTLSL